VDLVSVQLEVFVQLEALLVVHFPLFADGITRSVICVSKLIWKKWSDASANGSKAVSLYL
jgi:hypothetical protein